MNNCRIKLSEDKLRELVKIYKEDVLNETYCREDKLCLTCGIFKARAMSFNDYNVIIMKVCLCNIDLFAFTDKTVWEKNLPAKLAEKIAATYPIEINLDEYVDNNW